MARVAELAPRHMWFLPFLLGSCLLVKLNGQGLSVIGPKFIRPNSTYTVAVSNSLNSNFQLEMLLEGSHDGNTVFKQSNKVLVNRRTGRSSAFKIDSIPEGEYSLAIRSLNPDKLSFSHEVELLYENKTMSIFIQTDKPVYNPGDKVRFRVVVVDVDTRPVTSIKTVSISLHDAQNNSIREWGFAKLNNGVFESVVQLASSPLLGNWTLAVKTEEREVKKYIEVKEYVLPKFYVKAYPAEIPELEKKEITVTVESAYTFGKLVDGMATIDLYTDESSKNPGYSQKTPIAGLATVKFNLKKEVDIDSDSQYGTVRLVVTVMETFTNRTVSITQPITIFRYPYQISVIKSTPLFLPGVPYTFSISVRDHYGNLPKADNNLKLGIEYDGSDVEEEETQDVQLSGGLVTLTLNPPPNANSMTIKAEYESVDYEIIANIDGAQTKSNQYIRISLNKKYRVVANKEVSFDVTCTASMGYFSYIVTSRGSVVASNTVNAGNKKKFSLRLKLTPQMAPTARLIVSYTNNQFLIFDELELNFETFNNDFKFEMDQEEYAPGNDIHINVVAAKDSYVAFHAIDESVLLAGRDGYDFTKADVLKELALYGETEQNEFDPFNTMGLFLRTTAELDFPVAKLGRFGFLGTQKTVQRAIHIRTEFPESWLWMNFTMDGRKSEKYFNETVPDTITSWKVGAFALSPTLGLGIMSQPQTITVKKPFFIVTNLPYSIKRDEIALIQVTVFNFLGNQVTTDVSLYNKNDEIEFIDKSSDNSTIRTKAVIVPTNNGKPISFMIKAKKLGEIAIKIVAVNLLESDAEEHMLRVTPESRMYEKNHARFIELPDRGTQNFDLTIDIPRNIDEGSAQIMFTLDPNILGTAIKNLDQLIRLPSGCGEQNMLNFVPNIVVLDYLAETGTGSETVRNKATDYLKSGYQNQLKYKRPDGAFSVWGPRDAIGSTFLTAFVAKSFKIADKYITIDKSIVTAAFNWLAQKQKPDGRFEEVGKVWHADMQGALRSTNYALTAYVLIAFLENRDIAAEHRSVTLKSLAYLENNYESMSDAYDLALSAYAMSLGRHKKRQDFINKLVEGSISDTNSTLRYWKRGSASVEVAGYALLSYVEQGKYPDATPIMRWLNNQRYGLGGYPGTQDTFVGLKALAKFAAKTSSHRNDYRVMIKYGNTKITSNVPRYTFDVDIHTGLNVQEVPLPSDIRQLNVEINGIGNGVFQIATQYHQNIVVAKPSFNLMVELLDTTTDYVQNLKVCSLYIPKEAYQRSNMALVEVFLPSGFVVETDAVEDLSPTKEIRKTELRFSGTSVVVYYDSLGTAAPTCFKVTAYRRFKVARHLPAHVVVYDYYDRDRFAVQRYEGKILQECDICEEEDCITLACK